MEKELDKAKNSLIDLYISLKLRPDDEVTPKIMLLNCCNIGRGSNRVQSKRRAEAIELNPSDADCLLHNAVYWCDTQHERRRESIDLEVSLWLPTFRNKCWSNIVWKLKHHNGQPQGCCSCDELACLEVEGKPRLQLIRANGLKARSWCPWTHKGNQSNFTFILCL